MSDLSIEGILNSVLVNNNEFSRTNSNVAEIMTSEQLMSDINYQASQLNAQNQQFDILKNTINSLGNQRNFILKNISSEARSESLRFSTLHHSMENAVVNAVKQIWAALVAFIGKIKNFFMSIVKAIGAKINEVKTLIQNGKSIPDNFGDVKINCKMNWGTTNAGVISNVFSKINNILTGSNQAVNANISKILTMSLGELKMLSTAKLENVDELVNKAQEKLFSENAGGLLGMVKMVNKTFIPLKSILSKDSEIAGANEENIANVSASIMGNNQRFCKAAFNVDINRQNPTMAKDVFKSKSVIVDYLNKLGPEFIKLKGNIDDIAKKSISNMSMIETSLKDMESISKTLASKAESDKKMSKAINVVKKLGFEVKKSLTWFQALISFQKVYTFILDDIMVKGIKPIQKLKPAETKKTDTKK